MVKQKSSSTSAKRITKTKPKAKKKVNTLPGQKHDPPEEREPLPIPTSKMAEFCKGKLAKGKPVVIEISSSSEEETKKNKSEAEKGRRRYSDMVVKTEDKQMAEEEDCYILSFNPFADDFNRKLSLYDAQSQSDDISIVAERGKVACRDYPHPRHLCGEYPFSKTSHESRCPKCYCYVCDDVAPCKFWKGPNGHCHAIDEDEKWKEMRKLRGRKEGTK